MKVAREEKKCFRMKRCNRRTPDFRIFVRISKWHGFCIMAAENRMDPQGSGRLYGRIYKRCEKDSGESAGTDGQEIAFVFGNGPFGVRPFGVPRCPAEKSFSSEKSGHQGNAGKARFFFGCRPEIGGSQSGCGNAGCRSFPGASCRHSGRSQELAARKPQRYADRLDAFCARSPHGENF